LVGSLAALSLPLSGGVADARSRYAHAASEAYGTNLPVALYSSPHSERAARASSGRLQCVPFARDASGIQIVGNAWTWWDSAAGVYQRGAAPESGAVLAFRSNRTMRLGHVAVVSRVVNPREIEIEHANWGSGISRDVRVVDVSPGNDWTAVRVALAREGDAFGSVYPTHGFIYDRPDRGTMVASTQAPAPIPALNPPQQDLRAAEGRMPEPVAMSYGDTYEEVAEAPQPNYRHRRNHQR
jgi:surface antigen